MLKYLAVVLLWMLLSMLMASSWQRGGGIWIIMEEKWSGQRYQPQSRDYHQHLHHNTQCNAQQQQQQLRRSYHNIIQLKFSAICAMFYFNSVHNSSSHNKELKNWPGSINGTIDTTTTLQQHINYTMHIAIKYIELCVLLVTTTIDHASFSLLVINMRALFHLS